MTGYNPINSIDIDLEKSGICKEDGLRFTDPLCTHATPEQIVFTIALDAEWDSQNIFGVVQKAERVIDAILAEPIRDTIQDVDVRPTQSASVRYDGTEPSPIIYGGEVLELGEQIGHSNIPL